MSYPAVPKLPAISKLGGSQQSAKSSTSARGQGQGNTASSTALVPVPESPRQDTVIVSSSRTRYALTPRAVQDGEVRRLTPREMYHITAYITANKNLNHTHRAGKVTQLIPEASFVRLGESADDAVGLSIAPAHPKESALDVPIRLQAPSSYHAPILKDAPLGTTLSARIVMLLKGTSTVPQHWEGEKQGLEKDVAHTNVLRDLEIRVGVAQRSKNARQEAVAHYSIGALHYNAGALEKAVKSFVLAGTLFQQIGDPQGAALCHNLAGVVYYKLASYKMALIHHKKQEDLCGSYGRCVAQTNMGVCYAALGEAKYAQQALNDALSSAIDSKDPVLETIALGNAGLAAMRLGDLKLAQTHFEGCLEHCSVAGDKVGAAVCLLLLGEVYSLVNDFEHALFYYEHSFRLGSESGCRDVAEIARVSIGVARGSQAVKDNMVSTARKMGAKFGTRDVLLCLPDAQDGTSDP